MRGGPDVACWISKHWVAGSNPFRDISSRPIPLLRTVEPKHCAQEAYNYIISLSFCLNYLYRINGIAQVHVYYIMILLIQIIKMRFNVIMAYGYLVYLLKTHVTKCRRSHARIIFFHPFQIKSSDHGRPGWIIGWQKVTVQNPESPSSLDYKVWWRRYIWYAGDQILSKWNGINIAWGRLSTAYIIVNWTEFIHISDTVMILWVISDHAMVFVGVSRKCVVHAWNIQKSGKL